MGKCLRPDKTGITTKAYVGLARRVSFTQAGFVLSVRMGLQALPEALLCLIVFVYARVIASARVFVVSWHLGSRVRVWGRVVRELCVRRVTLVSSKLLLAAALSASFVRRENMQTHRGQVGALVEQRVR